MLKNGTPTCSDEKILTFQTKCGIRTEVEVMLRTAVTADEWRLLNLLWNSHLLVDLGGEEGCYESTKAFSEEFWFV